MVHFDDDQSSKHLKGSKKAADDVEKNALRILLAEDDYEMRALLAESLRRAGYEVIKCTDGMSLLEELGDYLLSASEHKHVDLVISDIRMPGITGLEILEGLQHLKNCPPIILITAFGDRAAHERAAQYGVAAMLDKPFDMDELLVKILDIAPRVNLT